MKQQFLLCLFVLLFSMGSPALPKDISLEDQMILEKFFKTLFEQSEFGYVFYQKKPACGDGYSIVDRQLPGFAQHEWNVYLQEGAQVWKRLNPAPNNEYVLGISDAPDHFDENARDINFIHRKLFLDTIKKNIELFQYVLGPEVTPQHLLDQFEDPKQTLCEILKQDNVLIGIILGFGAQNSLVVSRMERLEKEFSSPEIPPLKPLISRLHLNHLSLGLSPHLSMKKHFLFSDTAMPTGQKEIKPSFGFDSITQEYQALSQKIIHSSEKLKKEYPLFLFGRLKDDPESDVLIQELETAQATIQTLLQSPTFFPQILKAMTSEEISLQPKNSFSPSLLTLASNEIRHLPAIIAESIFRFIREEEGAFFDAFCKGMRDADNNSGHPSLNREGYLPFYDLRVLRSFRQCKENLQQCTVLFDELDEDPEYFSIAPKKLYYRISKPGHGSSLKNEKRVLVHYSISSGPEETLLCQTDESPHEVDVSECISGFHRGMLGMQIGEKREIYIHPSLAYGVYTTLDKGQYLKAAVQLLNMYPDQQFTRLPSLEEIDIESEIPSHLEETYQIGLQKNGYSRGYQTWSHYKQCELYSLEQVLDWIETLKKGENVSFPPSIDANRTINRLHWNIYAARQSQRLLAKSGT